MELKKTLCHFLVAHCNWAQEVTKGLVQAPMISSPEVEKNGHSGVKERESTS
jgi:hypothetical protein